MRITNGMTTNNILLNLNKSNERMSKLQIQIATGQKIQHASENPIVASFALKFRTNISETSQYKRNAEQAESWMNVTEQAINNTTKALRNITDLCRQAASETNSDDRKNIVSQIAELKKQLTSESNADYAGRYVFGGYKTDQELMFTKDKNASYDITQNLTSDSIEKVAVGVPVEGSDVRELGSVERIKLPYTDAENLTFTPPFQAPITATNGTSADYDAYAVGDDEVKYLADTGEILLGKNAVTALKASGNFEIGYSKDGFTSGDLNPEQYFNCTKTAENGTAVVPPKVIVKTNDNIEYEFGVNNKMAVNVVGSDVFTPDLVKDLNDLVASLGDMKPLTDDEIKTNLRQQMGDEAFDALKPEELAKKITDIKVGEEKTYRKVATERLGAVMTKLDIHREKVSLSGSELGSRMNRLELISDRLIDDKTNYSELMSLNEGIQFEESFLDYVTQQTIYNSALSVGAKVMQKSLLDFL